MIFGVAAMVIFSLAMVITILMTIASEKMAVLGWPENCLFRRRHPLGERTGKRQRAEKPSRDAETQEMYIYAKSEKYLRYGVACYERFCLCPSASPDTVSGIRKCQQGVIFFVRHEGQAAPIGRPSQGGSLAGGR